MGYKYKPNKSVAKRFRVTGTGKLKMRHTMSTHLRSARDAKKKRFLGRPAILAEGHARNMREMMGIRGTMPNRIKHQRALRAAIAAKAAAAAAPAAATGAA
jgi:large subunit ribosomal protein L35